MDTVDKSLFLPCHKFRHASVGKQHELLDQPVGFLGNFLVDTHRTALFVHLDLHLRPFETDGSCSKPLLAQFEGKAVEGENGRFQLVRYKHPFCDTFSHCRAVLVSDMRRVCSPGPAVSPSTELHFHCLLPCVDYLLGSLICEPVIGIDDRPAEPLGCNPSERSDFEYSRECELRLPWTERAQLVGKFLGQHRHSPVHEIYRSAPCLGLIVHDRARVDVMGDISYMDSYFVIAVFEGSERKGVIEVLGVSRVYSECEHI